MEGGELGYAERRWRERELERDEQTERLRGRKRNEEISGEKVREMGERR